MRLNRNTWVVATCGDRRALRRRSEATDARSTSGLRLQKVALAFYTLAPASAAVFLPRALWSRPSSARSSTERTKQTTRLARGSRPLPIPPLLSSPLLFLSSLLLCAFFFSGRRRFRCLLTTLQAPSTPSPAALLPSVMPANVMRAQRSAVIVASAASSSSSSSSPSAPAPQNRGRIIVPVAKKLVGPSGAPLRGASAAVSAVVAPDRATPKDGPLILNGQVSRLTFLDQRGVERRARERERKEREKAFRSSGDDGDADDDDETTPPPRETPRAVDFVAALFWSLLVPVSPFRSPASSRKAMLRALLGSEEPRAFRRAPERRLIVFEREDDLRFSFVPRRSRSLNLPLLRLCPFQNKPKPDLRSSTPAPPSVSRSSAPSTTTSSTRSTRSSRTRRPAGSPPTSCPTQARPTLSTRSASCARGPTACPTTTSWCWSAT